MRLILVRHPRPVAPAGVCYGSTDLAADADDLDRVAHSLATTLPQHTPVYSSPMRRCAALAARLPNTLPSFDARLVEMHFGAWEMRSWDTIARAEIDAWAADLVNYRPGGGDSVLAMAERVAAFHDDLLAREHHGAIIICHAGTLRLLAARHAGLAPSAMALQAAAAPHQIAYGATLILER